MIFFFHQKNIKEQEKSEIAKVEERNQRCVGTENNLFSYIRIFVQIQLYGKHP